MIYLPYYQSDFSTTFRYLDYRIPSKNIYKYVLEGYQDTFLLKDGHSQISFNNLDPGNYELKVWGGSAEGILNPLPAKLNIRIGAPWYWNRWSIALYIFLFGTLLTTLYVFQLRRRVAISEARKIQEFQQLQSKLYTNITHEFRTPLTVISGMVEQIQIDPENWFRDGLSMIKRNARQVLSLVNQMLDLAKIESGYLRVEWVQTDLVRYIKYLMEPFIAIGRTVGVKVHFLPEINQLVMDVDTNKLQIILSNLIQNAVKFTPEGGDIYLTIEENHLVKIHECVIGVRDTGIGIKPDQVPFVFDRFFEVTGVETRASGGTGIGLTVVKEYVELLGGNIRVESFWQEGTKFTIVLPIHHNAPVKEMDGHIIFADELVDLNDAASFSETQNVIDMDQSLALIIEDHPDVQTYIASILSSDYRIITAKHGKEGMDKAIEWIPDVIISDVMMPFMDGFELTEKLKLDERTNHIPIILLTAKADHDSKLLGLLKGSDAYLSKPFDPQELKIIIQNQIHLRNSLQKQYQEQSTKGASQNHINDHFIKKVTLVLEANLDNDRFGIPELCQAIGISRTQLHRKIKALTNQSTSHFIRSFRMYKAKELLINTDMNVTEVGYAVGYLNRSHFSQDFSSVIGQPPSFYKR
ncbi:MAG: hybrid sensor histidine kinase/response regulator transcription factor [Saprospiraceae bacterium]